MSYSAILIPGTGVLAAYSDQQELSNAIGLFLIVWSMFTAMLVYVLSFSFFSTILGISPLSSSFSYGLTPHLYQTNDILSNQPSCITQEYFLYNSIRPTLSYIPHFRCIWTDEQHKASQF